MKYVVTYAVFASTPIIYERDTEADARSKVVELVDMHLGWTMEFAPSPVGHAALYVEAMEGSLRLDPGRGTPQAAVISVYVRLDVPELQRYEALERAARAYFETFDGTMRKANHAIVSDMSAALRELEGR